MKTILPSETNKKNDIFSSSQIGDMHNLMNYFWNYMDMPLKNEWTDIEPKIEICESDKDIEVMAELPGIDEKDVDLKVSADGYLTITGEKRSKNQTAKKGAYFSEISYGMFKRTIPLPGDINYEAATADFNNGILQVMLPKLPKEQQKMKKINIKTSDKM